MSEEKKSHRLAAFWKRRDKDGEENGQITGTIEIGGQKLKVSIIPNTQKEEGSRQPDFLLAIGSLWKLDPDRTPKPSYSLSGKVNYADRGREDKGVPVFLYEELEKKNPNGPDFTLKALGDDFGNPAYGESRSAPAQAASNDDVPF